MTTTNNETVELHGWVLTQIPSRAFYDDELHAQAVRLLGAFCFHARLEREAWPGFEKMVDKIPHMSERTGYRALEELRDAKYIYRYLTDDRDSATTHIFVTKEEYDKWVSKEDRPDPTCPNGGSVTGDRGGVPPMTEGGLPPMAEEGVPPMTDKIDSVEGDSVEVDSSNSAAPPGASPPPPAPTAQEVGSLAVNTHLADKQAYKQAKRQRKKPFGNHGASEATEADFLASLDEGDRIDPAMLEFDSFPNDDWLQRVQGATGRTKFYNQREMGRWLRAIDAKRKKKLPQLESFLKVSLQFAREYQWSYDKFMDIFCDDQKYVDYSRHYADLFEKGTDYNAKAPEKSYVGNTGSDFSLAKKRAADRARTLPAAP